MHSLQDAHDDSSDINVDASNIDSNDTDSNQMKNGALRKAARSSKEQEDKDRYTDAQALVVLRGMLADFRRSLKVAVCRVGDRLNPQTSTPNTQPSNSNPQPSTPNPQPPTLNPQPCTSGRGHALAQSSQLSAGC